MHSVAEARCVARTGSWASFDRSRDCHRGGFSRLESGTTTPLPPPQKRPGVRADFLHVKKKKKKKKEKAYVTLATGLRGTHAWWG